MSGRSTPEPMLSGSNSTTKIEKVVIVLAVLAIIICPLLLLACFRVIPQYKKSVVLRFGRIRSDSPAGPGIVWILPLTDECTTIDLRTQSFNLPPQQDPLSPNLMVNRRVSKYIIEKVRVAHLCYECYKILTKDSVTVTVDAVGYYHIMHPLQCLLKVQYYRLALELIAVCMLRNVLGQYTLADALTSRQSMSAKTKEEIDLVVNEWGIQLERLEIKNILLPFDLQRAMAVEAEATRVAKAKLIEANGEIKAAENLRDASRLIAAKPQVMLLRYLQALNYIASQQKTSIIFPFPIEIPESLRGESTGQQCTECMENDYVQTEQTG